MLVSFKGIDLDGRMLFADFMHLFSHFVIAFDDFFLIYILQCLLLLYFFLC